MGHQFRFEFEPSDVLRSLWWEDSPALIAKYLHVGEDGWELISITTTDLGEGPIVLVTIEENPRV